MLTAPSSPLFVFISFFFLVLFFLFCLFLPEFSDLLGINTKRLEICLDELFNQKAIQKRDFKRFGLKHFSWPWISLNICVHTNALFMTCNLAHLFSNSTAQNIPFS